MKIARLPVNNKHPGQQASGLRAANLPQFQATDIFQAGFQQAVLHSIQHRSALFRQQQGQPPDKALLQLLIALMISHPVAEGHVAQDQIKPFPAFKAQNVLGNEGSF